MAQPLSNFTPPPPCPHTQVEAFEAYANREFSTVLQKLEGIVAADPDNPRWFEMRAQVGNLPDIILTRATACHLWSKHVYSCCTHSR